MTWRQLPAIWAVEGLRPAERLVLLALAYFADSNGANSYPAQQTLASMCSCSPDTVKRALRTLRERGLITATGKGRKGTIRYAIELPMATAPPRQGGAPPHPQGGHQRPTILLKNPINKKEGGLVIDRFSDLVHLEDPPRHHPDSAPEPSWLAAERSRRSRRR